MSDKTPQMVRVIDHDEPSGLIETLDRMFSAPLPKELRETVQHPERLLEPEFAKNELNLTISKISHFRGPPQRLD